MPNITRSALDALSLTNFPNNTSQQISPADLRDWLDNGIDSFVTQKDSSRLENVIYENQGSGLAAAASVNLALATGNYLHITGAFNGITSFGVVPAGGRFVLVFDGICTLTDSATLILPGGSDITTAAGDCAMLVSEGSGNWRMVGFFPISGGGGGGITALTGDVTASGTGSVTATIANSAVDIPMLSATGTPSATTFLRGDNVWATPAGASPTGYYGAFKDTTTQTAVSANTAYPVKFNTTDLTNSVTVVNDGSGNPTRITLANAGIYNIQFSLQLEKTGGSGNFIVDIWIRKNGVDIPGTTGKVVLTGSASASPIVAAWNYVLDLAATDYVQLMWSTSNNNAVILSTVATPPHPSVPSAILTVTQQAGIMAGTGITSINSLTGAGQTLASGTSGTDFAIVSSGTSHTFNIPDASASARGLITTGNQTLAGIKTFGNGASAGEIRLLEPSGSGTESVGIKAQAMGSNYDLTLPVNAGTSGQVLQTNGSGLLSWTRNGGSITGSFILDTTETSATGTAELINKTLLIPANTFSAQTSFKIIVRIRKDNAGFNNANTRIYIGTNPASIVGAFSLGLWTFASAGNLTSSIMERSVLIINATTQTQYNFAANGSSSISDLTNGINTINAIDWTVNQYIIVTTSTNAAPYSTFIRAIQIIPQ
jgi:hypothetical protein